MNFRCFISILLLFSVFACSSSDNVQFPTIAIGEFRFSGSAESGQYAPHLFKLKRIIGDEFAKTSGWTFLETEQAVESAEPMDQEISGGRLSRIFNELNPSTGLFSRKGADYRIVGEMDGFDLSVNDRAKVVAIPDGQAVGKVARRSWIVRTRVNMRIIDVKQNTWLNSEVVLIEETIDDDGTAESQIANVLQNIAQKIVARTLLSISGYPKVTALDSNSIVILNRGLSHGLEKGMLLEILRDMGAANDPDTGKKILLPGRPYGRLEVVDLEESTSRARFKGEGMPNIGDATRSFQKARDPIETAATLRNLRIAMGGFHTHGKAAFCAETPGLMEGLEASVANSLNQQPGLSVVEQDSDRIRRLMAQQMLTDLNKGREPGLPLGTLSGVDYLVFGNLVSLSMDPAQNPLKQMGFELEDMLPRTAQLHAFLYIQDVNTGEHALSEEIKIRKSVDFNLTIEEVAPSLLEELADEASQRFLFGIRPLHIISANPDQVLLNHGENAGIKIGDQFEAFTIGENQVDPYTGAILHGVGAKFVARVEVIGFSPQDYAVATLSEGKILGEGLFLRPIESKTKHTGALQSVSTDHSAAPGFLTDNTAPPREISDRPRLLMGGILHTPTVEKELGESLLNQIITEMESRLIEQLLNDGGFIVVEQQADKLRKILAQRCLNAGGELNTAELMKGIAGADYVLYARITTAHLEKGKSQYVEMLDEEMRQPGKLNLQASVYLQNVATGNMASYKNVRYNRKWDSEENAYTQWSKTFHAMTDEMLSLTLLALRPLVVEWVQGDSMGLNHGESSGLKTGDRLKIYNAEGMGDSVAEFEISGFGPTGRAEARHLVGGPIMKGMLVKLEKIEGDSVQTRRSQKQTAAEKRQIAW
ncbi:MAG: hypothetical protein JEZ02_12020 [Desulfatibacillum sp.]|nr:hypothetical protein [Desulfatibacillum sp.]